MCVCVCVSLLVFEHFASYKAQPYDDSSDDVRTYFVAGTACNDRTRCKRPSHAIYDRSYTRIFTMPHAFAVYGYLHTERIVRIPKRARALVSSHTRPHGID